MLQFCAIFYPRLLLINDHHLIAMLATDSEMLLEIQAMRQTLLVTLLIEYYHHPFQITQPAFLLTLGNPTTHYDPSGDPKQGIAQTGEIGTYIDPPQRGIGVRGI